MERTRGEHALTVDHYEYGRCGWDRERGTLVPLPGLRGVGYFSTRMVFGGSSIVFPERVRLPLEKGRPLRIWRHDLVSGESASLTFTPHGNGFDPAVTATPAPDGQRVTVCDDYPKEDRPRDEHHTYFGDLTVLAFDGAPPRVIGTSPGWRPEWSPDGRHLIAGHNDWPRELGSRPPIVTTRVLDPHDGTVQHTVEDASPATGDARYWSPDSRRILLYREGYHEKTLPFGFYDLHERTTHWFDPALMDLARLNPPQLPMLLGYAGTEHLLWHSQKGRTCRVHSLHIPTGRTDVVLQTTGPDPYAYVQLTPMPVGWWDLPTGPATAVHPSTPATSPDPAPGPVLDEDQAMTLLTDPDAWHAALQAVADDTAGPTGPRIILTPWTLRRRTPQPGTCLTDPTLVVTGAPDDAVHRALTAAALRFALVDERGTEHTDPGDADSDETFTPSYVSDVTTTGDHHAVRIDLGGTDYPLLTLALIRTLTDALARERVTEATISSAG
ncbi:TolB family protein [Cellulomonas triticagri]|uniref:TolB family protein n=1 Tax=Cellulomonas triticagri TaxID=2483352 RepID=UPI0011C3E9BC|nr:hypothetical protein [Cellulomonas triticagri]